MPVIIDTTAVAVFPTAITFATINLEALAGSTFLLRVDQAIPPNSTLAVNIDDSAETLPIVNCYGDVVRADALLKTIRQRQGFANCGNYNPAIFRVQFALDARRIRILEPVCHSCYTPPAPVVVVEPPETPTVAAAKAGK